MERDWVKDLIEKLSSATLDGEDVQGLINSIQQRTPSSLFKIRECKGFALKNLAEKTLYLGGADAFNDPYDTAFWVDYRKLAAWEKLDELGFSGDQVAIALNSGDPVSAVAALASSQQPQLFNAAHWLHEVGVLAPNHQAGQLPWLINQLKSSHRICSLSERVDSVLMWSHYGADHTGFAMEYDFTGFDLTHEPTFELWPVAYTNKLFDVTHILRAQRRNEDSNALYGVAASLCKAADWVYEREWRLVSPGNDRKVKGFNVPAPLKAVHLGAKILDADAIDILKICSEIDIPVFKVMLASHEYRMVSVPTDLEDWCSMYGRQQGNMPSSFIKKIKE